MENTNKDQRSEKLFGICKFLQKIHLELQSYGKTIKQAEKKERKGMNRWIPTDIWGIKKNNKPICILSSKKER